MSTGYFESDKKYLVLNGVKSLILLFSGVYVFRIVLRVRRTFEKNLVRHQNLIVISLFYQLAFGIVMMTKFSEIAKHPAHLILYHSLPTLYGAVLMFLYSVSSLDSREGDKFGDKIEVTNRS